jgi:hypothetical protein
LIVPGTIKWKFQYEKGGGLVPWSLFAERHVALRGSEKVDVVSVQGFKL